MSDTSAYQPPPPDRPSHAAHPAGHRSSMAPRHAISAVLALVLTPVGMVLTDLGAGRWYLELVRDFEPSFGVGIVVLLAGLVLLALAAACGRISGLGPLLAALVWGVAPAVWYFAAHESFIEVTLELPELWDHSRLFGYGVVLFPLVAAMLAGAAVAGRWSTGRAQPATRAPE